MNRLGKERAPFLFIIDFENEKPLIFSEKELKGSKKLLYTINGRSNHSTADFTYKMSDFTIRKKLIPYFEYKKKFDEVKREFIKGNSYLLNLTFPAEIKFKNKNITLFDVYMASFAKYKLYFEDRFVVFSPESFVEIKDGVISTFPMKGTIKANLPFAKERLINNQKELAEHTTVVDLLRNDLSMVSKNVRVENFRYVEKIKTNTGCLYATSSKICGKLESDYNAKIGDIIRTLLPAGSVSGAPKPKTLEIIRRIEGKPRGYYCGVFGFFDGKDLESAVMIRYIEKNSGKFYYRSGGGLTIYSNPKKEYNELRNKIYVPICREYMP